METLIPVSILGALLVFLVKLWFERESIKSAISADMQLTLRRARETLEALERDDHYWLKAGTVLNRAPSDIELRSSLFIAVLPKLHLLGAKSVVRVLAFYTHYQFCDGLKRSLFQHIENHAKSQKALTDVDVRLLQVQNFRICAGFRSLLRQIEQSGLSRFTRLPIEYEIPTTKDVTDKINATLSSGGRMIFLPEKERRPQLEDQKLQATKST